MNNAHIKPSLGQILFLAICIMAPISLQALPMPPSANPSIRQSSSTLDSNPGYEAFDGDFGTAWQLASGATSGWVEQVFTNPRQLASAAVTLNLPTGVEVQFATWSGNQWLPIPGGRILGPVTGLSTVYFPGSLAASTKVLVRVTGAMADQTQIQEISFSDSQAPADYSKIVPLSYIFNQPEYINLKPSRLWDGVVGNSWFAPLREIPRDIFETDSSAALRALFPRFSMYPSQAAEIIWDLGGSFSIDTLKAFINDSRSAVTFEFDTGSGWANPQTLDARHSGNEHWQRTHLSSPITAQRVRITFPNGWVNSDIGELEVWGTGSVSQRMQALPLTTADTNGDYHYTISSTTAQDSTIDVVIKGSSSTPLMGEWNGVAFSIPVFSWINQDTMYRIPISKTDIRVDAQFLKLHPAALIESIVFYKTFADGHIPLAWPYADGITSHTTASPGTSLPIFKGQHWPLNGDYQLEKIRVYGSQVQLAQFYLLDGPHDQPTPVFFTKNNDGSWEANLNGLVASELRCKSPVPISIDEIQLLGSPTTDSSPGLEIWWPLRSASFDLHDSLVLGWRGNTDIDPWFGNLHANVEGHLYWSDGQQFDAVAQLLRGQYHGHWSSIVNNAWRSNQADAVSLDQDLSLASTSDITFVLSGSLHSRYTRIFVNNTELSTKQGKFNSAIGLKNGFQMLNVQIFDASKRFVLATLQKPVYRTVNQPIIQFELPAGDFKTAGAQLSINGSVGNGLGLSLKINGAVVSVANDLFQSTITLQEGANQIPFELSDNTSRKTVQTLTVIRDSTAPTVTITNPIANQWLVTPNITLAAVASEPAVWWQVNQESWVSDPFASMSKIYTLNDGWYTFSIKVQDQRGNISAPATISFGVDATPPLPYAISSSIDNWSSADKPIISFSTNDVTSGMDHYELSLDGGAWIRVESPFTFSPLINGEHVAQIRAFDKAGNFQFAETHLKIDKTPPAVPTSINIIPASDSLDLHWTSVDDGEGFQNYRLERVPAWSDGLRTLNRSTYGNQNYVDSDVLAKTIYSYRIWAIDRAGNVSTPSDWIQAQVGIENIAITANGPTVAFFKDLTLTVPQAALSSTITRLQIIEIPKDALVDQPYYPFVSLIYHIRTMRVENGITTNSAHADLNDYASLAIHYDPSSIPDSYSEGNLKPCYYDDQWGRWIPIDGAYINTIEHIVYFKTNHFSDFAIQASSETALTPDQLRSQAKSPFGTVATQGPVVVFPDSGVVSTQFTEMVLPGKNGLDLTISRVYDTVQAQANAKVTPTTTDGTPPEPEVGVAGMDPASNGDFPWYLGYGWRLNMPSLSWKGSGLWVKDLDGKVIDFRQTILAGSSGGDNPTVTLVNHEASDCTIVLAFIRHAHYQHFIFDAWNWETAPTYTLDSAKLILKDGRAVDFDSQGRVVAIHDAPRLNAITFTYKDNQASTITDTMGRTVAFSYEDNKIKTIGVSAKGVSYKNPITYTYTDGKLTKATDIGKRDWAYDYTRKALNWYSQSLDHPEQISHNLNYIPVETLSSIKGPGKGQISIGYNIQSLQYEDSNLSNGITNNFKMTFDRLFGQVIDTYESDNQQRQARYDFTVAYGGFTQFYTQKSSSTADGRITIRNAFDLVTIDRASLSSAPEALKLSVGFDVGERHDTKEVVSQFKSSTTEKKSGEVAETRIQSWDTPHRRLLNERVIRFTDATNPASPVDKNYRESAFLYDDWGNTTSQIEHSVVNGRESLLKKTMQYFNASSVALSAANFPSDTHVSIPALIYNQHNLIATAKVEISGIDGHTVTNTVYSNCEYNTLGQLVNSRNYTGSAWAETKKAYDSAGELSQTINPSGLLTTLVHEYPATGSLYFLTITKQDINLGGPVNTSADLVTKSAFNCLSGTEAWRMDARGFVTSMSYDDLNRTTAIMEPSDQDPYPANFLDNPMGRDNENPLTTIAYDDEKLSSLVTAPLKGTTGYQFDTLGRLTTVTVTNTIHNALENTPNVVETIVTSLNYDGYDQVTSIVGPISSLDASRAPERTSKTIVSNFSYDDFGRMVSVQSPGSTRYKNISYNDHTNSVTKSDENGNSITEQNDWTGNIIHSSQVAGTNQTLTSSSFYDGAGNLIQTIDPNGNVTTQHYNAQGLVDSIQKPARDVTTNGVTTRISPTLVQNYDIAGRVINTLQDLDDGTVRRVDFTYNSADQVLTKTMPVSPDKAIQVANEYDASGNVVKQLIGYQGETTTKKRWNFDSHNRVLTVFDQNDEATRFTYDKAGNRTGITDPRQGKYQGDFSVTLSYNQLNRLILATLPKVNAADENPTIQFIYDSACNLLERKQTGGQDLKYTYTPRNQVATESVIGGNRPITTKYEYDYAGRLITTTSPSGKIVTIKYDKANRLVGTGNTTSGWTTFTYDPNGNKIAITDGLNNTSTFEYTVDNLVAKATDALNHFSTTSYDRWGQVLQTVDREKNTYSFKYDQIGRLTSEITPWDTTLTYQYDAWGNVTNYTDPRGTTFVRSFTPTNLLRAETATDISKTQTQTLSYEYDEAGDIKSADNGIRTEYNTTDHQYSPNQYGALTRANRTIDGLNFAVNYQYDSALHLTGVRTPDNQSITYGYNSIGQLSTVSSWINNSVQYDESSGMLIGYTMANNVVKSVAYDDQARITNIGYKHDSASIKSYAFTYDVVSNVSTKKVDSYTPNSYNYDKLNQLIRSSEKGQFQQKVNNSLQMATQDRDFNGKAVLAFQVQPVDISMGLDMGARSLGVDLGSSQTVTKLELHPKKTNHRVNTQDITVFAGLTNDNTGYQEITGSAVAKTRDGIIVVTFSTPFDARFIKVLTPWDDRGLDNETADSAEFSNLPKELLQVWVLKTYLDQDFSYDDNGNRTQLVLNDDTKNPLLSSYYLNSENRNTERLKYDGEWYYQYDQAGNRIVKAKALIVAPTGSTGPDTDQEYWNYEWDLYNRLVGVKKNGIDLVSYKYDAENYRVQRQGNDGTTYYTYGNNGNLLYTENTTSGLKRSFAYMGETIIGWTDTLGSQTTKYFALTDELGSVTQVLSSDTTNPKVLWSSEYSAFGQVAYAQGDLPFGGMYTGKDIDPDTGLTYNWHRWRSEDGSRFISEDPAHDGSNWYGYAKNSPMRFTDPTGLDALDAMAHSLGTTRGNLDPNNSIPPDPTDPNSVAESIQRDCDSIAASTFNGKLDLHALAAINPKLFKALYVSLYGDVDGTIGEMLTRMADSFEVLRSEFSKEGIKGLGAGLQLTHMDMVLIAVLGPKLAANRNDPSTIAAAFIMAALTVAGGPAIEGAIGLLLKNVPLIAKVMKGLFGKGIAAELDGTAEAALVGELRAAEEVAVVGSKISPISNISDFMASQVARLQAKLGAKIGKGELPFARGPEGFKAAVKTVEDTLNNPTEATGIIPSSALRGDFDLVHVYSADTNFTVSLRAQGDGSFTFDTLIAGKSSKF